MNKIVYLLNFYCDTDKQEKDFESWLINVLYKINLKTLNQNIIVEYCKLYEKRDISRFD